MSASEDLSALVSSRICHDLISPVGAIGNGLELLLMTHNPRDFGPEFGLIQESVDKASAQIRLYRVAFGKAEAESKVSGSEIMKALDVCYDEGRVQVRAQLPRELLRADVKCALLALMCVERGLRRGGDVEIRVDGTDWTLDIIGDVVSLPVEGSRQPDCNDPAEIQKVLLPDALRTAGRRLQVERNPDRTLLRF